MTIGSGLVQFLCAAALVGLLDLLWMRLVAEDLYRRMLGGLLAERADGRAALLFYVVFIAGLVYFVIGPAIDGGSIGGAALDGAIYGLVTYATWDLTSLSVLEGFPAALVPIDIGWGMLLAASTSAGTYAAWLAFS